MVTSTVATLTVRIPPAIVQQPTNLAVALGGSATFTVAAVGDSPLSYQWRFNSTEIPGATGGSYPVTDAEATDAGPYRVVVKNPFGSVTSAVATLTVMIPPLITQQPASLTVTQGQSAAFTVAATGDSPLWYQWRLDGTNILDATNISHTVTNAGAVHAGGYTVVVGSPVGSVTSIVATLTVRIPPTITQQPASLTVRAGYGATFGVGATGDSPLSYQWRFNNTDIPGATSSLYGISAAQLGDAGGYSVVISNAVGVVTSAVASLTVTTVWISQHPQGVSIASGADVVFSVVAEGTGTLQYQWFFNGTTPIAGATDSSLTLPDVQAPNNGTYSVTVSDDLTSLTSSNATLTVLLVRPLITVQPKNTLAAVGGNASFFVEAQGSTPMGFRWRRNNTTITNNDDILIESTRANSTLTMMNVPLAYHSNRFNVVVTNAAGTVVSSNAVLTLFQPPLISLQPTNQIISLGASVTFNAAATGDAPLSYQWRFNGTNIPGATNLSYRINAVQTNNAGSYDWLVTNLVGSVASQVAVLTVIVPPTITVQPQSQTVKAGSNVTFTMSAQGTAPFSYQWRHSGTNLPGATAGVLTLTNIQASHAGDYAAVVANSAGSATSAVATLTVIVPPDRAVRVVNVAATAGGTASLPIELVARGNENALGFSLNFDLTALSFTGVTLGGAASEATLNANTNQLGSGRLGLSLALPWGSTFAEGTQEVVRVSFQVSEDAAGLAIPITFGNLPVYHEVADSEAQTLPATFADGAIAVDQGYEADVTPLPRGNGLVTVTDWVKVGRYSAGLDVATNRLQFQRADCAPRSSLGNGALTISDWVQAGRYAAGLDPLMPAGGRTRPEPRRAGGRTVASTWANQCPSGAVARAGQRERRGIQPELQHECAQLRDQLAG